MSNPGEQHIYVAAPAWRKRQAVCSCGWRGRRRLLQGCAVTDAHLHAAELGCQPAVPLGWPIAPAHSHGRRHADPVVAADVLMHPSPTGHQGSSVYSLKGTVPQ